jgi:transposase-like protein
MREQICQELARELGISAPRLYRWQKNMKKFGRGSFPGKVIYNEYQKRTNAELKETQRRGQRRDIIKK